MAHPICLFTRKILTIDLCACGGFNISRPGMLPPKLSYEQKSAQGVQLPSDSVCVMTSDCELLPSLEALPSLSKATRLSDAFLTQLVRLCCIEELPLVVLAHESYRLAAVSPAQDGTDKVGNRGMGAP
ncbi:unnamed protein product [Choristocarpus tenellus]